MAGIGKETARAFAEAGAKRIGILGRREQVLQSTRDELLKEFGEKGLEVVVAAADVKDVRAMKEAAGKYGEWDVLCLNAGYMADKGLIPEAEADEWWNGFEVCFPVSCVHHRIFPMDLSCPNLLVLVTLLCRSHHPQRGCADIQTLPD